MMMNINIYNQYNIEYYLTDELKNNTNRNIRLF